MLLTHAPWPYQPEKCPADDDFLAYCKAEQITGKNIFVMGPGEHHNIGKYLALGNNVLAITCSWPEMESYKDWAVVNPEMAGDYVCTFGDIYTLNSDLLPLFDIIYLPHLGEMMDERRTAYGAKTPMAILNLLLWQLRHPGLLIGYNGSSAWDRMNEQFQTAAKENGLRTLHRYKSLDIWQRPV